MMSDGVCLKIRDTQKIHKKVMNLNKIQQWILVQEIPNRKTYLTYPPAN